MIRVVTILLVLLFCGCRSYTLKEKKSSNQIDYLQIVFFKSYDAQSYIIKLDKEKILVSCEYCPFKKEVTDSRIVNKTFKLIDDFFVSKSKKIIIKKDELGYSRYYLGNILDVKAYKDSELVIDSTINLSFERYEVEFHKDFLDLVETFEHLTSDKL